MKRWLVVIISIGFSLFCHAGNDQELFLQGNEAYKQQRYEQALTCYQDIEHATAEVLYNMGVCYLHLDNLGQALVYLRKAEKRWGLFNRSDLATMLQQVRDAIDKRAGLEQKKQRHALLSVVNKEIKKVINDVPLICFQFMVLIFWIVLFVLLKKLHKSKKRLLIVGIFSCLVLSSGLLAIKYGFENRRYVVVIQPHAIIRSGPSNDFKQLTELYEGAEGYILEMRDGYYKVRFADTVAWIAKELVNNI